MGGPQACHRGRDADGARPHEGGIGDDLAIFTEVHVPVGKGRGGLPIIEKRTLAAHVHKHEPAAADIAGFRQRDGEGKGCGNSGIHRVAPRF